MDSMREWTSSPPSVSMAADRIPSGVRLIKLLSTLVFNDMSLLTAHITFLQSNVTQSTQEFIEEIAASFTVTTPEAVQSAIALEQQMRDVRWATMLVRVIRVGQYTTFVSGRGDNREEKTTLLVQDVMQTARVDDVLRGIESARAAVWQLKRFFEKMDHSPSTSPEKEAMRVSDEIDHPPSAFKSDTGSDSSGHLFNPSDPTVMESLLSSSPPRHNSRSSPSKSESGYVSSPSRRVRSVMAGAGSSFNRVFRRKRRSPIPKPFRKPTKEQNYIRTLAALEEQLPIAYIGQTLPLLRLMDRRLEVFLDFWKEWGVPANGYWILNEEEDAVVIRGSWVKREWDIFKELSELEATIKDWCTRLGSRSPRFHSSRFD
ncbi:hypothetical protein DACRYDRAFT_18071 [Dacryopinax primogenitus]|uniref:Uncharacterized protein n=1 Tax=Dacryopinax primogenitus (strain DJM 731) TaxID=1858805 RepID=M5FSY8_DACPD|nr:uncharacterized protein DACRYDRAFT_18071 [Dacryopinax primogenitus]EJT98439.1 hypothetical protein DACRYDRAFT_18071 [Dacryopinax primogenitus]